jgi:hypothetical protein
VGACAPVTQRRTCRGTWRHPSVEAPTAVLHPRERAALLPHQLPSSVPACRHAPARTSHLPPPLTLLRVHLMECSSVTLLCLHLPPPLTLLRVHLMECSSVTLLCLHRSPLTRTPHHHRVVAKREFSAGYGMEALTGLARPPPNTPYNNTCTPPHSWGLRFTTSFISWGYLYFIRPSEHRPHNTRRMQEGTTRYGQRA